MIKIPSNEFEVTPYWTEDEVLQAFIDSATVISIPWSQLDEFEHITEPLTYTQYKIDFELILTPELIKALRQDNLLLWSNEQVKVVAMAVDDDTYPLDWPEHMYKEYGVDVYKNISINS